MEDSNGVPGASKKGYVRPSLVTYGSISKLTQNGTGSGLDGNVDPAMAMSICL